MQESGGWRLLQSCQLRSGGRVSQTLTQFNADYAGKNKLRAGTTATVTVMENHKSQHQL
jgi:hypothetical protein